MRDSLLPPAKPGMVSVSDVVLLLLLAELWVGVVSEVVLLLCGAGILEECVDVSENVLGFLEPSWFGIGSEVFLVRLL